jgi:hypothetical protein
MLAVFIILAVFSVPLAAIASSTYLKARRIDAEGGAALKREVLALQEANVELQKRVEVLEEIATDAGARTLGEARQKVEELHELELAARRAR